METNSWIEQFNQKLDMRIQKLQEALDNLTKLRNSSDEFKESIRQRVEEPEELDEYQKFCNEKVELYQDARKIHEAVQDIVSTKINNYDGEVTGEVMDRFVDEAYTELQDK